MSTLIHVQGNRMNRGRMKEQGNIHQSKSINNFTNEINEEVNELNDSS